MDGIQRSSKRWYVLTMFLTLLTLIPIYEFVIWTDLYTALIPVLLTIISVILWAKDR